MQGSIAVIYFNTPPPRRNNLRHHELVREPGVCLWGQNLRHHIRNVVAGGHELETDELISNLLAQPRHLYAEVAVAAGDHMVADHRDTGNPFLRVCAEHCSTYKVVIPIHFNLNFLRVMSGNQSEVIGCDGYSTGTE